MYARVTLWLDRRALPLTIPASAVLFLTEGLTVAEIGTDHAVHRHMIDVGRDFESYLEVLTGVSEGCLQPDNPSNAVPKGRARAVAGARRHAACEGPEA